MLSTAEIATEMYLSVNTVKTHLNSQDPSKEHLPQAVGDSSERGRPPRTATRADLTSRCCTPWLATTKPEPKSAICRASPGLLIDGQQVYRPLHVLSARLL
jgi:hypothetical protein